MREELGIITLKVSTNLESKDFVLKFLQLITPNSLLKIVYSL